MSFSEKVVVAGTSSQILEVYSFCDRERAKTFFNKNNRTNVSGKKQHNEAFWVEYFLECAKNFYVKSRTRRRLRPQI